MRRAAALALTLLLQQDGSCIYVGPQSGAGVRRPYINTLHQSATAQPRCSQCTCSAPRKSSRLHSSPLLSDDDHQHSRSEVRGLDNFSDLLFELESAPPMEQPEDVNPMSINSHNDNSENSNGMALTPGSNRELDDILMERSLRFYDPRLTGDREKAFLVGLEETGYGSRRQRSNASVQSQGEPQNGPEAAAQRRQDWEDRFSLQESLSELSELAGTAGLEVCGSTYQRVVEPNPRTYIGTGKVAEVKRAMRELGCKTVIIDHELSPGQQRSLEQEFGDEKDGIKVLDRTALILDIFAQHARTKEGQLQVELALHLYRLPRLTKLWTHLERQSGAAGSGGGKSGGVGLRGPGERQLEVDRRLLKEKITDLQRALLQVRRHRALHRRRREALGLPVVALVGYTNAGKSTVLNALTSAGVLAEDMLFATLDPTTRRVKLPGLKVHPEIMFTDTVGFIQKLPTNLVAAFRATLEEVKEADVIVHVCDVSNSAWKKQHKAVMQVLNELGALDDDAVPVVTLWNKLDLIPQAERSQIQTAAESVSELTVAASAATGEGMGSFIETLETALAKLLYPVEAVVPYSYGQLISKIHELGACDEEKYTETGCLLRARVPLEILNRLKPYYTDSFAQAQAQVVGSPTTAQQQQELDELEWGAIARKRHAVRK